MGMDTRGLSLMPSEQFHVVTEGGDDITQKTLPAAWKTLTIMGVAGRVDRVSDMNDPGRVTVASRSADGDWTMGPGANGPAPLD